MTDCDSWSTNVIPSGKTNMENQIAFSGKSLGNLDAAQSSCKLNNIEAVKNETATRVFVRRKVNKEIMACEPDPRPTLPTSAVDNLVSCKGDKIDGTDFRGRTNDVTTFFSEYVGNVLLKEAQDDSGRWKATNVRFSGNERIIRGQEEEWSVASDSLKEETKSPVKLFKNALLDMKNESEDEQMKPGCNKEFKDAMPSLDKEQTSGHAATLAISPVTEVSVAQKQFLRQSAKMNTIHSYAMSPRMQSLCKSLEHDKAINTHEEKHQRKRDPTEISMVKKLKQNDHSDMHIKKRKTIAASISPKVCFIL